MTEKCPLTTLKWRNQLERQGGISDICRTQCEPLWDNAIMNDTPDTDSFTEHCSEGVVCGHDIEVDDMSLQPDCNGGTKRYVGLLNVCAYERIELFAEGFSFECPNADSQENS